VRSRGTPPASDGNDPVTYANDVAGALGVPVSTIVGDLSDEQMTTMQDKIQQIEGAVLRCKPCLGLKRTAG